MLQGEAGLADKRPYGEQGVTPVGNRALARRVKIKSGRSVPWNNEVCGVRGDLDGKDDNVGVAPVYVDRLRQPECRSVSWRLGTARHSEK